ncbi:tRNA (adenosine(37)-N6)-dimethylallyltransferase MiaA [Hyphobacterium marinum]|uniref:tRNA dimethylallyltransferase n=1 Tax=Hyphobacterium marinum TaxID=3116574 RepID=A0ABU7M0N6_9PROT|nr:tRNA (adenosine(37)-N6)-dimethylallyltransferase MiaA [Hyphobacterium sp. Y6023]MEE2566965.1 tRNA (adenosine(37)-N6)-dimethylallyltransferase MiaA [Hyphobacterium sp. Y6023]
MSGHARPVLLVGGPTASGKTALALTAARELGGEIINADSMQIYREIPILSAQPSVDERGDIPHHLFGVLPVEDAGSTGWWSRETVRLITDIRGRGRIPVIVGGTGLYFSALTDGIADIPETTSEARAEADRLEEAGMDVLRAAAERYDPDAAARAKGDDRARLRRIVEVGVSTGRAISEFQADTRPALPPGDWTGIVIEPDREALYARIDARFEAMLSDGAWEEAKALQGHNRRLPALKAVGLPWLLAHLDGEIDADTAIAHAKRDSRRYAKRQYTWFRNQCSNWSRIRTLDVRKAEAEFRALNRGPNLN